MNWRVLVLAAGIGACVAGPATAQDGGFYLGARGIGSFGDLDTIDVDGFSGTENVENDDDEVAGVGGIVGYRFEDFPFRAEIEGSYRFRFDMDVRDQSSPVIDYETDIATTTVLLNAFVEWRNTSDFTPFVGGTVGWARNTAETERNVLGGGSSEDDEEDNDNLAWGAVAGVDWLFLDYLSAELAYRFIHLGDVDAGEFSTGESLSAENYTSHDIMLSLSYRF